MVIKLGKNPNLIENRCGGVTNDSSIVFDSKLKIDVEE
jgi:hypothetical protein